MSEKLESVLDRVVALQKKREADAVSAYRLLVEELAAERAPAADRIDAVLREAGKSAEDLKPAVALLVRRRELATIIKKDAAVQKALVRVRAEKERLDADMKEAERLYREKLAPLEEKEREALQSSIFKETAETELANSAEPELKTKLEELRKQVAALGELHAVSRKLRDENQDKIRFEERQAPGLTDKADLAKSAADIELYRGRLETHAAKCAELDRQIEEIHEERRRIYQSMILP